MTSIYFYIVCSTSQIFSNINFKSYLKQNSKCSEKDMYLENPRMENCSAWLRLKLNTKMGLNHPTTPHHPTTRNFWKGSRHSRRLRFGMLASLKLRNRTHTHPPHPPTKSEHLTLSLGEGGNFKSKVIPS